MKAARFDYFRPRSLDEALDALAASPGASRVVAGSQSLGPMLNLRLVRPDRLIDISGLDALRSVAEHEGVLRIGAAVTHAQIEDACHPAFFDHPWRRVAGTIAFRSVRNRGTVGGSLAHADPAADWVLAAWAAGASVELARSGGRRLLPMRDFMQAAYTTSLAADEMVTAVCLPAALARSSWGWYKVCRKVGDFAEASCAVEIGRETGRVSVVVGALDGAPVSLDALAARIAAAPRPPAALKDEVEDHLRRALPGLDAVAQRMYAATVERAIRRAFGEEAGEP